MKLRLCLGIVGCALVWLLAGAASAQEYSLKPAADPLPAAELAAEIAALVQPTGHRVVKGASRTVIEFWPVKEAAVAADFKPSATVLYPLHVGQLIGVVRYKNKGGDFRGQEITKGLYTVRYALQPVDGNHVGTSDTRDFLVLVKAADDKTPAAIENKALMKLSAAAAGTKHPAMLALLHAGGDAASYPAVEDAKERVSIRFNLTSKAGDKGGELPVEFVVVGQGE